MVAMSDRGALVPVTPNPVGLGTGRSTARFGRRGLAATEAARSRSRARRRWAVAGALFTVLATALAVRGLRRNAEDTAFTHRVNAGCEELESCQRLEAAAERRATDCFIGCGARVAEHGMTRLMRYRSEERLAVRAHYRQREEAEQLEQRTERAQQLELWQRERAARLDAAEREHRRRMEVERLEQARLERRLAEERQRRVEYLTLLGAEGRAKRLRRCAATPPGCASSLSELLDAASTETEKRLLAELHEQLLAGEAPAPAPRDVAASGIATSS